MGLNQVTRRCQACGAQLFFLRKNNVHVYYCTHCGAISQFEIDILPLKKRLLELGNDKNAANFGYADEIIQQANEIFKLEADCQYAKFYYAIGQKLKGNDSAYISFLRKETYDYTFDMFTRDMVQQIVDDGSPKYKLDVKQHLRAVVSDAEEFTRLWADYTRNCEKKRRLINVDPDVFLCCCEADEIEVDSIYQYLNVNGFAPWSVYRDVPPMRPDRDMLIDKNMRKCEFFLFVATESACGDGWEEIEPLLRKAVKSERTIIEYRIVNSDLPEKIERFLPDDRITIYSCDRKRTGLNDLLYKLKAVREDGKKQREATAAQKAVPTERHFGAPTVILDDRTDAESLRWILRDIGMGDIDGAKRKFERLNREKNHAIYYLAGISFDLWGAMSLRQQRKVLLGEAESNYFGLNALGNAGAQSEEKAYAYLEQDPSDIAVLMISFYLMNDTARFQRLKQVIDIAEIKYPNVANQLIRILSAEKDIDSLKYLITGNEHLGFSETIQAISDSSLSDAQKNELRELLCKYGTVTRSKETAEVLSSALHDAGNERERIVYLQMLLANRLDFDYSLLASVEEPSEELLNGILRGCRNHSFNESDMDALITFAAKTKNGACINATLETLRVNCGIHDIGYYNASRLAALELDDPEERFSLISALIAFDLSADTIQSMLKGYLESASDAPDVRYNVIRALADHCKEANPKKVIPLAVYRTYLLNSTSDRHLKVQILQSLLEITASYESIPSVAEKYYSFGNDSADIKQAVLTVLGEVNAGFPAKVAEQYLRMPTPEYSDGYRKIFREYLRQKPNEARVELARYLTGTTHDDGRKIAAMIADSLVQLEREEVRKLLEAEDEAKRYYFLNKKVSTIEKPHKYICEFTFRGSQLECNLLQAVLITATQVNEDLKQTVSYLLSARCDLNDKLRYAGKKWSFRDFAAQYDIPEQICRLVV